MRMRATVRVLAALAPCLAGALRIIGKITGSAMLLARSGGTAMLSLPGVVLRSGMRLLAALGMLTAVGMLATLLPRLARLFLIVGKVARSAPMR